MPGSISYTEDLYTGPNKSAIDNNASQHSNNSPISSQVVSIEYVTNNSLGIPEPLLTTNDNVYIIWTSETAEIFANWFSTTRHYRNAQLPNSQYSVPTWNMKDKHKAKDIWDKFEQLAAIRTGEAKIKCMICQKIMNHPASYNNSGTSAMRSHLKSIQCVKIQSRKARASGSQPSIAESIAATVLNQVCL
jgi:hypothetical protein